MLRLRSCSATVAPVKCVRIALVLALLALWVPASSHALLEHAGWIHEHHHEEAADHDHDHDADHGPAKGTDHDAADGICRVESGSVDAPAPQICHVWLLSAFALCGDLSSLTEEPDYSGPSPPGTAPPEVRVSWQFSYRAALPVRAPSLLS